MKKLLIYSILIISTGCRSRIESERTALLQTRQNELIASSEPMVIPITFTDPHLTKEDRKRLDRHYPTTLKKITKNQLLDLKDIVNLTRSGIADPVIIHIIETSDSVFFLTSEDEQELEQAGVSKKVIVQMKNTSDSRY